MEDYEYLFLCKTLRPGFPNEKSLPPNVPCVGKCVNIRCYPLVLEPRTKVPFLLFTYDDAHHVKRVLHRATEAALHESGHV